MLRFHICYDARLLNIFNYLLACLLFNPIFSRTAKAFLFTPLLTALIRVLIISRPCAAMLEDPPCLLWVGFVCINRMDLHERKNQSQLMHNIFSSA